MRHHNSVFHDVLKHVPWAAFDRLVETHGADKHVRRLSTKSQFVALVYGQLSGAVSLREIAVGLQSHGARLYHVGAKPVSRSTLADANAKRPSAVFGELFAAMVAAGGDAEAIKAQFAMVGKNVCDACHKDYQGDKVK